MKACGATSAAHTAPCIRPPSHQPLPPAPCALARRSLRHAVLWNLPQHLCPAARESGPHESTACAQRALLCYRCMLHAPKARVPAALAARPLARGTLCRTHRRHTSPLMSLPDCGVYHTCHCPPLCCTSADSSQCTVCTPHMLLSWRPLPHISPSPSHPLQTCPAAHRSVVCPTTRRRFVDRDASSS